MPVAATTRAAPRPGSISPKKRTSPIAREIPNLNIVLAASTTSVACTAVDAVIVAASAAASTADTPASPSQRTPSRSPASESAVVSISETPLPAATKKGARSGVEGRRLGDDGDQDEDTREDERQRKLRRITRRNDLSRGPWIFLRRRVRAAPEREQPCDERRQRNARKPRPDRLCKRRRYHDEAEDEANRKDTAGKKRGGGRRARRHPLTRAARRWRWSRCLRRVHRGAPSRAHSHVGRATPSPRSQRG